MVLRMKNFNVFGVHRKIQFLGGGGSQKTNIEGGVCLKRVLGQFANSKGGRGLAIKRGWYFRGGLIPQCIL